MGDVESDQEPPRHVTAPWDPLFADELDADKGARCLSLTMDMDRIRA